MAAGVSQESRSSGKFVVIRQVQDNLQVGVRSGEDNQDQCSPVIAGQIHGDDAGTRSSWKVSLWVRISLGQA